MGRRTGTVIRPPSDRNVAWLPVTSQVTPHRRASTCQSSIRQSALGLARIRSRIFSALPTQMMILPMVLSARGASVGRHAQGTLPWPNRDSVFLTDGRRHKWSACVLGSMPHRDEWSTWAMAASTFYEGRMGGQIPSSIFWNVGIHCLEIAGMRATQQGRG
jgi:hypothetical protein